MAGNISSSKTGDYSHSVNLFYGVHRTVKKWNAAWQTIGPKFLSMLLTTPYMAIHSSLYKLKSSCQNE